MPRYTLIFGNGLGRALDNDYFQLESGLAHVWRECGSFTEQQKGLVISAIPGLDAHEYPSSEEQLDILQVAIVAAGFLNSFESEHVKWLSDDSRELPHAFRRFIHEVALYFHDSGKRLPDEFLNVLSTFIRESKSHVAVLNYDNLLYDGLKGTGVLNGYYDTLIDGFHRAGFDSENLDRHRPDEMSWYLHLHGSPLYVGNRKLMRDDRASINPTEASHVVLTHVEHKPLIINSSHILTEYWKRLAKSLNESEKVVLFGYSGCDTHLNNVISSRFANKDVVVVSRNSPVSEEDNLRYWREKIPDVNIELTRLDNILDFVGWEHL